ncbi:hypothetical protein BR93DRAFT_925854 [Coniochaeta sp. PMI_546]|nr:hypothetical protein BR93DRAFT_925854 [Coniochaeta sp. PMI_546]
MRRSILHSSLFFRCEALKANDVSTLWHSGKSNLNSDHFDLRTSLLSLSVSSRSNFLGAKLTSFAWLMLPFLLRAYKPLSWAEQWQFLKWQRYGKPGFHTTFDKEVGLWKPYQEVMSEKHPDGQVGAGP